MSCRSRACWSSKPFLLSPPSLIFLWDGLRLGSLWWERMSSSCFPEAAEHAKVGAGTLPRNTKHCKGCQQQVGLWCSESTWCKHLNTRVEDLRGQQNSSMRIALKRVSVCGCCCLAKEFSLVVICMKTAIQNHPNLEATSIWSRNQFPILTTPDPVLSLPWVTCQCCPNGIPCSSPTLCRGAHGAFCQGIDVTM